MRTISPRALQSLVMTCAAITIVAIGVTVVNVAKALSAPAASSVSVPSVIGFEGFLADNNGQPLPDHAYALTFTVYDAAVNGSAKWTETQIVTTTVGVYSTVLGALTPFPVGIFDGQRWVGVRVNAGTEITPRTQVASVPFALNAEHANTAENATTAQTANTVDWSGIVNKPSTLITGTGAANTVALWTPTNTITGAAGLTYSDANFNVLGGLNLGASTGATAGQLKLSGQILQSTSIGVRVYNSSSYSVSTTTLTPLPFDSERLDTNNLHSTINHTTRLIAPVDGVYLIIADIRWSPAPSGNREIQFQVNGTTIIGDDQVAPVIGDVTAQHLATIYALNANDYVEVFGRQTSGGPISIDNAGHYSPEFMMVRMP